MCKQTKKKETFKILEKNFFTSLKKLIETENTKIKYRFELGAETFINQ